MANRTLHPSASAGLVVLLALALIALVPGVAPAGRPLDTEDTTTVEPGHADLELSLDYAKHAAGDVAGAKAVLSAGIVHGVEARIEAGGVWLDPEAEAARQGVADTLLGLKYRLLDESPRLPAALIGLTLRLPTGDDDRGLGAPGIDVGVVLAIGKIIGPVALSWNVGYTFVTADRAADFWTLAASVEYGLITKWLLVAEVVSTVGADAAPNVAVARVGAVHALTDRVRLDAAIGTGLTASSPDLVATFGVTLGY